MTPDQLKQHARDQRHAALKADDAGHDKREHGFERWLADTVFEQGVNRLIYQIGSKDK